MIKEKIRFFAKLDTLVTIVALGMVAYQFCVPFYLLGAPEQMQNYHLGFAFVLVFLVGIQKSKRWWTFKLLLVILSLIATGYIHFFYHDLELRLGFPIVGDVIIGVLLLLLCLEGTRQSFGLVLPLVVFFYLIYAFFGYHLPEPFTTMEFPPDRLISKLTILQGIYGMCLGISLQYIFLFILFGSALKTSGAIQFFIEIGKLIGGKMRGGTGTMCLVAGALIGMVTGVVSGSVVVIGSFALPLMEKVNLKGVQKGGILSCAGTGAQLMPPVMGATAFVMSAFTGIPYINLCFAAALPAILFFYSAILYSQFQAGKMGILPMRDKVDTRELLLAGPIFIIPLLLLVTLMAYGYTPMFAISRSLLLLIAISFIRKKTRPSLAQWARNFEEGAVIGARLGVVLALMGIIITISTLTGLGIKLPSAIEGWAGGYLPFVVIITAVVALILGMGMDVLAVYVVVAIAAAPVLIKLGIGLLQAHMFTFYYAVMSFVTPPVALAAVVASRLVGEPFFKTGIEATKTAAGGFFIPILFLLCPVLLLQPQPPLSAAIGIISTIIFLTSLQIAICDYYLTAVSLLERGAFASVALVLMVSLVVKSYVLFAAGVIVFILLTGWQLRKKHLSVELTETVVSSPL